MLLAPPQPALDTDAVSLFRAELPPGAIPAGSAALAENIAGASPFLRQLMLRDPAFAGRVFTENAVELLRLQLAGLRQVDPALSQAEVMARLRQAKRRVALLVAVEVVPDLMRTLGNVTYDVAVAAAVDRGSPG